MKRFILCVTLVAMIPAMAMARAHCHCKLESLGRTIKDFGDIGSYGTQQGHDADCRRLCDGAASGYMNATNRASAPKLAILRATLPAPPTTIYSWPTRMTGAGASGEMRVTSP